MLVSSRRPRTERKSASHAPRASARAAVPEIAPDDVGRFLADRHQPLLAALAANVDGLAVEVDVGEVEPDGLGAAQPARVDELHERAVSERERLAAVQSVDDRVDLGGLGRVGQPARASRAEGELGNTFGAECAAEEGPDGGEAPGDARRGKAAARPPQVGRVVGEHAHVHVAESQASVIEPVGEVADVAPVGAARRVAQAGALQEPPDGGVGALHRPRWLSPTRGRFLPA